MRQYLIASSCLLLTVALLVITACAPTKQEPAPGGAADNTAKESASDEATPAAAPPGAAGKDLVIAADKGALAGVIRFDKAPPKPKTVNFGAEIQCAKLHKTPPPLETLVVNPNGTVKWMLVSIKGEVPGDYKAPAEPAVIDQSGCMFVPHVLALMEGQAVEFRNSDPVTHNVRGSPKRSTAFNLLFPPQGPPQRVVVDRREIGVPLKCDIHFWMSGFMHVMRHPFFSVTGDEGTFTINNIPPGKYTLETWHETLKPQTQEVTIEAGKLLQADFVFSK